MKFAAVAILLAGAALAAPLRSNGSEVVCGSDDYTTAQIQAAAKAACAYVNNDEKAGSSKYPEKYNDYEGFTFHGVEGPYYEFPIMKSGKVYTGGSPGADRIVINDSCVLAGEVTHTGASGNDFVGCSGTS